MLTLQGVGTSFGIGDGLLYRYISPLFNPRPSQISDAEPEVRRLDGALEKAGAQLTDLHERVVSGGMAEEDASILDMQREMLCDPDFLAAAHCAITEHHLCAEYAIFSTGKAYAAQLRALDDAYLCERGEDVLDAVRRVLQVLAGDERADMLQDVTGRVVLAADSLLPSQALQIDRSKVAAFLMREGAQNSHTAILARGLGIPTVTGLSDGYDQLKPDLRTMVDGASGLVVQEPDTETMSRFAQKMLASVRDERQLQLLRGAPAQTQDGVCIRLSANIALPQDAKKAVSYDAEGIGLFRSETLCWKDGVQPTEDELYQSYREVLLMMGGKRVVVRLLDSCGENSLFRADAARGETPPLGFRTSPFEPEKSLMMIPQLRALLRASAYGKLAILVPRVLSPEDLRAVRKRLESLRGELRSEHRQVAEQIEIGALIETPAAALTVDLIATQADFISIGTNDLTQYILLADRNRRFAGDERLSRHPAVLRAVAQAARAAHKAGLSVSISGESASDPGLTAFYAGLHVEELSMEATNILKIKRVIRSLSDEACRQTMRDLLCVAHAPHIPASGAEETGNNKGASSDEE